MTACIDSDWRVLLVMPLHAKLLLLRQLPSVDRSSDIRSPFAEHGQCGLVNVVVYQNDGMSGLLDQIDDLHVCIEDLTVVEDSFNRRK